MRPKHWSSLHFGALWAGVGYVTICHESVISWMCVWVIWNMLAVCIWGALGCLVKGGDSWHGRCR